jgi:transposase
VRRIENGEILRNVAADFGVGISTVSDWVKSKFEDRSSKMPNGGTLQPKNAVEKKKGQTKISDCFRRNL